MPPKKREPRQPASPSLSVTPGSIMADSPSPSSLVTEVNSSLFGKPKARKCVGKNTESSNLVPASPQCFSSPNVDSSHILNQQGSSTKAPRKRKEPARKKPKIASENTYINRNLYLQQQSLKMQQEPSWVQHHPHPQLYNNPQPRGMPPPAQHLSPALGRLKMFLNDLRQRPADNSSEFWHTLVALYYTPQAKHRWCFSACDDMAVVEQYAQKLMQGWCFSLYDNVAGCGATKDAWKCDLCCASSGKGFEATRQNLPRLYQIKFEQGLIEELYKFGKPSETHHPSGLIVLEFAEASVQSNYVQEHTDHKGHLRILFTHDLKILQWDFCVQRHEEFLRCSSLAPQVNLFNFTASKIQSALAKSERDGLSPEELRSFSNMLMATTDVLMNTLETQSFTVLGLPIGFASTLQMSEDVSSAKSSIDVSQDQYICPVGPNLQMHSGAYITQQNDCRPYRESPFAQDVMNNVQQTCVYNGRQSFSDPRLSGMGSCDVSHPLMSNGVQQSWINMANNPSDVPKQSISEPCNVSANVEVEAPILSSRSVENNSGSASSPASISNSVAETLLSGNCEFNSAVEGVSPSSDSSRTPQNLQCQETNAQAQELDDCWINDLWKDLFGSAAEGVSPPSRTRQNLHFALHRICSDKRRMRRPKN